MQFNLLETGYVTAGGSVYISLEDMADILSVSGTVTVSGIGDDNIWIAGDIVDRVGTYQIRYYFDSDTSSDTVSSGISFSYKNDAADSYSSLTTNIGEDYYYTTVPDLSAPRYIRLEHSVSGTAINGTIVGLEVLNDDSVVDFGADGTLTSSTTLTSLNYLNYNDYIKEIEVYNSGSSMATAHVFIDPQYNDSDELLSISASEDGPWVFARNIDYIISNGNNWLAGKFYDTYTFKYSNSWDDVNIHYYINISNNGTTATATNNINKSVIAKQGIYPDMLFSRKWYWEISVDNKAGATNLEIGIGPATLDLGAMLNGNSNTYYYKSDGNKCSSSSCTAYGATYTTGDIIGIAFDGDTGKIWFSKNGVWQDSGDPGAGANPAYSGISLAYTYMPACGLYNTNDALTASFVGGCTYPIPEGFLTFEIYESDGKLRLYSNALVGSYITPIFRNDSVKFAYIDLLATTMSGSKLAVDADDYTSTIEIRSSFTKPIDYNVYRYGYTGSVDNRLTFYYRDRLISNDVEVYASLDAIGTYFGMDSYPNYYVNHSESFYIDQLNGKFVYIESHRGWDNHNVVGFAYIFISTHDGRNLASLELAHTSQTIVVNTYYMNMDGNEGVWLYLYTNVGGGILNTTGYFLIHLSSSLSQLYKEYSSSDFIIGCDVVKDDSGALWYSRATGTQAIFKVSSTGTILLSYDAVTDLGRLCSTYDGGCWFIDDDALYKLDSDGVLEDSITDLEINNELTWVMRDESDSNFLWIVDGIYIKLISLDGRIYRSIILENFTIYKLHSTKDYLVIYCTDVSSGHTYVKLIGRASGGIDKSILSDPSSSTQIEAGIGTIAYDNSIFGDRVPLETDPVWNDDLEWNKAVTENAILPREEYNQLKLTLRRPSADVDSPAVENIYYQDNVEIANIYSGQSKTLYLRISLPDGITIGGDYESNLRVWWELPVT